MECVWDGFCWGLFGSSFMWAVIAGWCYSRGRADREYLMMVLFVIRKLDQQQVWISPYDRAVINVAIRSIVRKWWQIL